MHVQNHALEARVALAQARGMALLDPQRAEDLEAGAYTQAYLFGYEASEASEASRSYDSSFIASEPLLAKAARDGFEEHQVNVAITAFYGAGQ